MNLPKTAVCVIGLIVAAIAACLFAAQAREEAKSPNIVTVTYMRDPMLDTDPPLPEDIDTMSIELFNDPFGRTNIAVDHISKARQQYIIDQFKKRDLVTACELRYPPMGQIQIRARNGAVSLITWYWGGGKSPLEFSINGCRFKQPGPWNGDEDAVALSNVIRKWSSDGR